MLLLLLLFLYFVKLMNAFAKKKFVFKEEEKKLNE
jgi:hypothetical protein